MGDVKSEQTKSAVLSVVGIALVVCSAAVLAYASGSVGGIGILTTVQGANSYQYEGKQIEIIEREQKFYME
jgi:hypothetical protein